MRANALPGKNAKKPSAKEVWLIFGQGPVINPATGYRAENENTPPGNEDINLLSKNLANAAVALYKLGIANSFIIMGGQTGGQKYASEAALIAKDIRRQLEHGEKIQQGKFPEIELEQESRDTLENFINFFNIYDKDDNIERSNITLNILCAPHHSLRLRVIAGFFAISFNHIFTSNEAMLHISHTIPDKGSAEPLLTQADSDRLLHENITTRELLERPEKWLTTVEKIKNDARVIRIVSKAELLYPGLLRKKYNVESSLDIGTIRSKLWNITYRGLSPEEITIWKNDNGSLRSWPVKTRERLEKLIGDKALQELPAE